MAEASFRHEGERVGRPCGGPREDSLRTIWSLQRPSGQLAQLAQRDIPGLYSMG